MVAAIKTEAIKQEAGVSAAEKTQRDLEDSEYGPNPEGELNAGCRKCNVVFGTAVELKVRFSHPFVFNSNSYLRICFIVQYSKLAHHLICWKHSDHNVFLGCEGSY